MGPWTVSILAVVSISPLVPLPCKSCSAGEGRRHSLALSCFLTQTFEYSSLNGSLPPVEMARLSNASARMMQIYQESLLVLQKLRTGGKQTVVVQHVQVSEGGQAVIAGSEIWRVTWCAGRKPSLAGYFEAYNHTFLGSAPNFPQSTIAIKNV